MIMPYPPSFHFEVFWPRFPPDFEQAVLEGWACCNRQTGPILRLDAMLRGLVRNLQRWAATKVGTIRDQLLMARALVHWLDAAQDHRTMTCLGLAALERTMARQRSRVRHLADGDANTAYFHLIARGKKRRQFIPSLSIAGHTISDHEAMEREGCSTTSRASSAAPSTLEPQLTSMLLESNRCR